MTNSNTLRGIMLADLRGIMVSDYCKGILIGD